ncbi:MULTISPECIES: NirD/YgiW/YdeI family stress tolerance protein [unclassified Acinetobacter]|uniref:NirD/YgiW/YdeI family stress tolerance protein n=1 Tax=unclassified Acinetobacter TaxID=196816 RepID=UPI0029344A76|nr:MULTISPECIES: NirD/YgiW/YdeI family stress tolerance protein [unclassified Acinetobacter]WOE32380.1 NirD/YgiW/YdeI family stress tolerance protein [Acinetobacter sp. SAAs470]WOE37853.1 NirD/YgiW/YdeI family stress tolerance protein [Acinetobacter sp. SAAs474]
MKLVSTLILSLALVSVTTLTLANTVVNQNAIHKKVTVNQALNMQDDSQVELKGYVVKSMGDEKYQFKDRTGSITVDIDDELWQGKPISAKTPVTLIGEVDVDYKPLKRVEIDVDAVKFD